MNKKNKPQILNNNNSVESDEYKKLLIIIGVVTLVFLIFYLGTLLLTKKDDKDNIFKQSLDASEIQYNEIIIGEMFNQKSNNYYVLLLEKDEQYKSLFEENINSAREKNKKIYTVDLTSAFNKKYISNESSFKKDNFKVKGTSLVQIEKGKIKNHYEDKDKIVDILKELTK